MPQYTLLGGGYRAEVTELGGAVNGLWHGAREIMPSWPEDGPVPYYCGTVLAPWPNRTVGAKYVFADECFELPVNEADRGHALHGLVAFEHWTAEELVQVEDVSAHVRFVRVLEPTPGYPHRLRLETRHELSAAGLTTTLYAENIGDSAAPYGCGPHPWLLAGPDVREYELDLPAGAVLTVDELLAPTGLVPVEGTEFDFRTPHVLGETAIDHAYTSLSEGRVRVRGPEGALEMTWDTSVLPWVQVCTGSALDFRGIAVEPMTCPPDAFNSGTDLVVLKPGDTHEASWTLAVI